MNLTEVVPTNPIVVQKTIRHDNLRVQTSSHAGKTVPLAFVPVHREDRVSRGNMRVRIGMGETAEMLLNAIHVSVYAHFIPFLAFERFKGMDDFNRSYQGIPETVGGSPIPFFTTINFDPAAEIWKTLGKHAKSGTAVNAAVIEAYNTLVNFRRGARSQKLPKRTLLDTTLAPAFWHHSSLAHIVSDFDQAMIDGEVNLQFATAHIPLSAAAANVVRINAATGGKAVVSASGALNVSAAGQPSFNGSGDLIVKGGTSNLPTSLTGAYDPNGTLQAVLTGITAELSAQGVKLSLSNIELAKKTAMFAQLRANYAELGEDHLIDLLMEGIRVPDEALKQPILLDRKTTIMGYSRRYATDAGNLAESVTNGETFVDLSIRTPPMNTGGIILITCEVVPEQLFERRADCFLETTDPNKLPAFVRDFLDPEKVSIVKNGYVDVNHSTPDATFGYAPLNHEWNRDLVSVGGKYYRPSSDATFVEDRQKIWSVEQLNPTLTADFYLATNLHQKVFADQVAHAFEYTARGDFEIIGNTQFGKGLQEKANNDFAEVAAQVDQSRIVQA